MSRILPSPTAVLGFRRDGRPIFPVLGASSEDPSNSPDTQVTFGQQQLQHLMAREKDQGARAGARALVDQSANVAALERRLNQLGSQTAPDDPVPGMPEMLVAVPLIGRPRR
ncbi:hypothetical protein ACFQL8_09395 [Streptomyces goshikiensis]|uniref:hypothetical protein n=1 Tax=Streptomyces goshikiensis TaxID=1942 RepID=UPI0033172DB8